MTTMSTNNIPSLLIFIRFHHWHSLSQPRPSCLSETRRCSGGEPIYRHSTRGSAQAFPTSHFSVAR